MAWLGRPTTPGRLLLPLERARSRRRLLVLAGESCATARGWPSRSITESPRSGDTDSLSLTRWVTLPYGRSAAKWSRRPRVADRVEVRLRNSATRSLRRCWHRVRKCCRNLLPRRSKGVFLTFQTLVPRCRLARKVFSPQLSTSLGFLVSRCSFRRFELGKYPALRPLSLLSTRAKTNSYGLWGSGPAMSSCLLSWAQWTVPTR